MITLTKNQLESLRVKVNQMRKEDREKAKLIVMEIRELLKPVIKENKEK